MNMNMALLFLGALHVGSMRTNELCPPRPNECRAALQAAIALSKRTTSSAIYNKTTQSSNFYPPLCGLEGTIKPF